MRDALDWCASLPEVPLYRRREEPARDVAKERIGTGLELLRRPLDWAHEFAEWKLAIERHLTWLHQLADGQVEAAQQQWHIALAAERVASARARLWKRDDSRHAPVFNQATGASRFDPRPSEALEVKLVCPHCRTLETFHPSALMAQHRFRCPACVAPFSAYLAQVRQCEVKTTASGKRMYFQLEGLGHELSRLSVDTDSGAELITGRGDLLAFLYAPEIVLRAVVNLNSSRILWLPASGPCFVVTVAFGEGSEEVQRFREFRDDSLMRSEWGRWLVDRYYRHGPALAKGVNAVPPLKAATRNVLTVLYRMLKVRSHV